MQITMVVKHNMGNTRQNHDYSLRQEYHFIRNYHDVVYTPDYLDITLSRNYYYFTFHIG